MTTDEYKYIYEVSENTKLNSTRGLEVCVIIQGVVRVTTDSYDNNLFKYVASAFGGCTVDDGRGARKLVIQR